MQLSRLFTTCSGGEKVIKIDGLSKVVNYEKITAPHCPSFSGIVADECKGELWVDHTGWPNIAIVNSYAVGGFAFLGHIQSDEAYNVTQVFIYKKLFPLLKSKGIDDFEFSLESENLREHILKMFAYKEIHFEKEFHYIKRGKYPDPMNLPEPYSIHEVNHEFWNLIRETNIKNPELITERILASWQSIDHFFKRSLSFCIMCADKIVAVIVGTARFNDVIAIDIATETEHRKKGLALMLTQTFVNECVDRGLTPQWSCVESNLASRELVEKAGFEFLKQNKVYWFRI